MSELARESSAYVLDCRDFRETSQLLVLLSEKSGRIDAVARGSRKAKGPGLDRFSKVFVVWRPSRTGGLVTLSRWELEETYPSLRTSYLAYLLASVWAESIVALTAAAGEEEEVYRLTSDFFCTFQQEKVVVLSTLKHVRLFWKLLESVGYAGSWRECAICKTRKSLNWFSFSVMAPLCDQCAFGENDVYPVSSTFVRIMGEDKTEGWRGDATLWIEAFFHLYGEIIGRITERSLPSLELLKKTLAQRKSRVPFRVARDPRET